MRHMRCPFILLILALAACSTSPNNRGEIPATPSLEATTTLDGSEHQFDLDEWESVVAAASGQTVNWHMWGGSESINTFVDDFYGTVLERRYNITLNRVALEDTSQAVEQLLEDKEQATNPGTIDLIWINGENFVTLKQAGMLYPDWNRKLPNSRYVNWENPALNLDFGEPIEGFESPWSSAQFQFIYDSARMDEDELPRSYAELREWVCANPGRFTYIAPGPGAFQGTRFVKGLLYEISGGAEQWREFDQALWDHWSEMLWADLKEFAPCLWQEGKAYPQNENELHDLFSRGEVDFSVTQVIAGTGPLIVDGLIPESARPFVFDNYMIGDFNYVAIPANAPHKAAALVLANLILEPQLQAAQIIPENGFGLGYGIDVTLVPESEAQMLEQSSQKLGAYATPSERLAQALVPEMDPVYQDMIEQRWREHVLANE